MKLENIIELANDMPLEEQCAFLKKHLDLFQENYETNLKKINDKIAMLKEKMNANSEEIEYSELVEKRLPYFYNIYKKNEDLLWFDRPQDVIVRCTNRFGQRSEKEGFFDSFASSINYLSQDKNSAINVIYNEEPKKAIIDERYLYTVAKMICDFSLKNMFETLTRIDEIQLGTPTSQIDPPKFSSEQIAKSFNRMFEILERIAEERDVDVDKIPRIMRNDTGTYARLGYTFEKLEAINDIVKEEINYIIFKLEFTNASKRKKLQKANTNMQKSVDNLNAKIKLMKEEIAELSDKHSIVSIELLRKRKSNSKSKNNPLTIHEVQKNTNWNRWKNKNTIETKEEVDIEKAITILEKEKTPRDMKASARKFLRTLPKDIRRKLSDVMDWLPDEGDIEAIGSHIDEFGKKHQAYRAKCGDYRIAYHVNIVGGKKRLYVTEVNTRENIEGSSYHNPKKVKSDIKKALDRKNI